jgi:hypothetical protein
MADLLLNRLGSPAFTWGSANVTAPGELRARYIGALRLADAHDITAVLTFERS